MVLKCRRAGVLGNKDLGLPTGVPRIEAPGNNFGVPNISESPLLVEERVRTFLRTTGNCRACRDESEEHGCIVFVVIV